ncbi:SDR family oxidoreductase [Cytobacillus sp. NCCP-133]|uniref:SDR family oxidoreductase n=1 Tax=Cytobacillus sp. NCCP-133 TaxID=766848 RepID=UPI002232AD99|nr:SDR family oxidoreductase [Cytobacillus sp. NCCP-133]GLB61994.1 putative sugar epimerase YhfK [Cytobacillus sp. NCCP-133]
MKILIVGANGQIGKQLAKLINDSSEHTVRAMIRKAEQAEYFEKMGAETVLASLEGTVDELAEAAKGCDAIVFTAGSGGHTGYDKTLLIDLDGAVKTIEAAQKAGIDRFVMVSAIQANNREKWSDAIKPYFVAKHYADRLLESSGLNYTIVRPGGLTDDPGTGKIQAADNLERGFIPRADVAKTVYAVLDKANAYKRSFDLISGEEDVEAAIKNI